MYTYQEAFDKVVNHLSMMKERSGLQGPHGEADFVCMYRGPNDTCCAIGILIPDEEFKEKKAFNTSPIYSCNDQFESLKGLDYQFLSLLQGVHDDGTHWDVEGLNETGYARLKVIAERFELTFNDPRENM